MDDLFKISWLLVNTHASPLIKKFSPGAYHRDMSVILDSLARIISIFIKHNFMRFSLEVGYDKESAIRPPQDCHEPHTIDKSISYLSKIIMGMSNRLISKHGLVLK